MCRNPTPIVSVSYVKTLREDDASGIKMKGSFSTKIESIVLKLIELIAEDPKIKVLIFSTVSFSVIYYFTDTFLLLKPLPSIL